MAMKFTNRLTSTILVLAGLTMGAQDNGMEHLKGYAAAKTEGVMAALGKVQQYNFGKKKNVYDPQARLLQQFGVRSQGSMLARSSDDGGYEFYGGLNDVGFNVPFASVTDTEGNTYITGGSSNESHPAGDMFTRKISPAGAVVWERREEAVTYAVDLGLELVLSPDGNLIATGITWNGNDMDIQTIKYNAATGAEIWRSTYDGGNEGIDIPNAVVTGPDGAVYITGISWSGDSVDYLTLKYAADGTEEWTAGFSAGTDTWSEATALALDGTGNVIVTGYSPNTDGWLNYHTIKYSPEGNELWAQAYNYEAAGSEVTNSVPRAVAADADGNVYVTGTFDTFDSHIGTIKYNAAGTEQWTAAYNETEWSDGYHIAVHENGIYVGGQHDMGFGDDGTVLLSYDESGDLDWAAETDDLVQVTGIEMLVDADGNIIIAGQGMTQGAEEWSLDNALRARKYSPDGTELGQGAFIVPATGYATVGSLVGIGSDGDDIYFSANSFYSHLGSTYETIKTTFGDAPSEPEWNAVYSNQGSTSASMLNAFGDQNGNTYSTGSYSTFADEMLNMNYFLVKHNAEGDIAWEKVFNAANGNPSNGMAARADADGNLIVYLVPEFDGTIRIKKYNSGGTLLWEAEKAMVNPNMYVLETGTDGSVYLGGTAFESEAAEHGLFAAIKWNADGTEAWTSFLPVEDAAANLYQAGDGKVTEDGDFILTGGAGTGDFMSQEIDLTVVKFMNDGSAGWTAAIPVAGYSATGAGMLVDSDGAIYTNGYAQHENTFDQQIITAKIGSDGTVLWNEMFGDAARAERSYTVKQFSDGAVAVVGYSIDQNDNINNVLIKYDADGNELWDFASENMRFYNDFHIDASDDCYIMDQAQIPTFPHRIYNNPYPIASLIKVDASGNGEEEFFIGPEYSEFYGERLIPHTDDRLLLAGSVGNESFYSGLHFFEAEHDGTLGIDNPGVVAPAKTELGQNYPNPAAYSTDIPFYLVKGGTVSIKLYNSQGRLIKEIANDTFGAGQNTVRFDTEGLSKGIYFYQMTAGKFKQARKLVKE